jgi:hypothetical protein
MAGRNAFVRVRGTYGRHKMKIKSYVAVQKKLLVIMYTLYKKGAAFCVMENKKVVTNADS